MRTESAMLERWFFYQDAAGLWKWARLDVLGTVLGHSGASFETRDACVEHATLNGYGAGKAIGGREVTQGNRGRFPSVRGPARPEPEASAGP